LFGKVKFFRNNTIFVLNHGTVFRNSVRQYAIILFICALRSIYIYMRTLPRRYIVHAYVLAGLLNLILLLRRLTCALKCAYIVQLNHFIVYTCVCCYCVWRPILFKIRDCFGVFEMAFVFHSYTIYRCPIYIDISHESPRRRR